MALLQVANDQDTVDITCLHPVDLPGAHIHTKLHVGLGNVELSLAACEQLRLWKKGRVDFYHMS